MTDAELKAQIALGLIKPEHIEPILVWGIQDPELLENLAKIFYSGYLEYHMIEHAIAYEYTTAARKNYTDQQIQYYRKANLVHEQFLNNPNTNNTTRIFINKIVNEIRKLYQIL
jgi:hypothetical protein